VEVLAGRATNQKMLRASVAPSEVVEAGGKSGKPGKDGTDGNAEREVKDGKDEGVKSVLIVHHPNQRFWVTTPTKPLIAWPDILASYSL
jgi:hypothetical protein